MKVRNWILGALALCALAGMLALDGTPAGSNPATGETTQVWPVFVLLGLSFAGLVIMLVWKLKSRK